MDCRHFTSREINVNSIDDNVRYKSESSPLRSFQEICFGVQRRRSSAIVDGRFSIARHRWRRKWQLAAWKLDRKSSDKVSTWIITIIGNSRDSSCSIIFWVFDSLPSRLDWRQTTCVPWATIVKSTVRFKVKVPHWNWCKRIKIVEHVPIGLDNAKQGWNVVI
jgi:hypothetical protein